MTYFLPNHESPLKQDSKKKSPEIKLPTKFDKAGQKDNDGVGPASAAGTRIYNPGDPSTTFDLPMDKISFKDLDGAGPGE
jgi:hypothetical protein